MLFLIVDVFLPKNRGELLFWHAMLPTAKVKCPVFLRHPVLVNTEKYLGLNTNY